MSNLNPNESEVLWESPGKTPTGDPFLTVRKARGYYYYASRGGMDSIFFVLINTDTNQVGLIRESKPPLDHRVGDEVMGITAFGGSIDMDKTHQEICQIEVSEEAGFYVPLDKIVSVGKTMVSTQMDQMAEGFTVDVTGRKAISEIEGKSKGNEVIWMDVDEVWKSNDWKSIFIIAKHVYEKDIK